MNRMRRYLRNLSRHPGVIIAVILTVIGLIAGGPVGAAIMTIFWIPVLLTTRHTPDS